MDFLRWPTAPSIDFLKPGSVSLSRLFEETKDEEDAFGRTGGFHPPHDGDVRRGACGRWANRGAATEGDLERAVRRQLHRDLRRGHRLLVSRHLADPASGRVPARLHLRN